MAKNDEWMWFDFVDQAAYDRNEPKWVAALRSGRYKQGNGMLLADGKYCCLGVACAAARFTKKPVQGITDAFSFGEYEQDAYAPHELAAWLGFKVPDRGRREDAFGPAEVSICLGNSRPAKHVFASAGEKTLGRFEQLVMLNDDIGATFSEIADLIEKHGVRARWV